MNVYKALSRRASKRRAFDLGQAGSIAAGFGAGLVAMYLLDPDRGTRRRAVLRDRAVHGSHAATELLDRGARDLRYRARGMIAEARAKLRYDGVTDEVLVERVRAKMGRLVAHPHAITVRAEDGVVTLSGPLLADERAPLMRAARHVRGVREAVDELSPHDAAENVSALQGDAGPLPGAVSWNRTAWTPSARLGADALGSALGLIGLQRGGRVGASLGLLGGLLLMRGLTNQPLGRLIGLTEDGGLAFQKTIHVHVPVEEAFVFWSDVENFPRFMEHVLDVKPRPDGRFRWVVRGPAGIPIAWESELTHYARNELIAWKSVPGALVRSEGVVRFDPAPRGGTRIDVKMTYSPPLGAIGHAIAALFRADPGHSLDDDLLRFQSVLDRGKTSAHGAHVTREAIDRSA